MARKRSHQHQRSSRPHSPGSERSYYEYLASAPAYRISRSEMVRAIKGGEDTYLELKVRFSNVDKLVAEIIALANTDGGAIVFGVNDQLRIEGVDDPEDVETQLREICARQIQPPVLPWINKIAFDNGRRIVILELNTANRPHRTLDDRFFLREGAIKREASREELSRLYEETHLTRFEQVPVFAGLIDKDIDESLFWSYVRGVYPEPWRDPKRGFPTEQVMLEMGLAAKIGGGTVPTIGGMMLFGLPERVAALLPANDLHLTRYSGVGPDSPVIEQRRLSGNLFQLFEAALRFIECYVDLRDERPSRRERREGTEAAAGNDPAESFLPVRASYHRGVITEALTNALIHRHWGARDRQARINIFDQSIELINPVATTELPPISMRYGIATPTNPRLRAVFTNQHYGLPMVHGGLPWLVAEAAKFVRRPAEWPTLNQGEFRLRLHGLC
ncbi:MAG: helix-turn-helix domain-containing protein [Acidobacteriota bacterium]